MIHSLPVVSVPSPGTDFTGVDGHQNNNDAVLSVTCIVNTADAAATCRLRIFMAVYIFLFHINALLRRICPGFPSFLFRSYTSQALFQQNMFLPLPCFVIPPFRISSRPSDPGSIVCGRLHNKQSFVYPASRPFRRFVFEMSSLPALLLVSRSSISMNSTSAHDHLFLLWSIIHTVIGMHTH